MTLPKAWQGMHRHAMLAQTDHDERARFDVLAALNHFATQRLAPEVARAWRAQLAPQLQHEVGDLDRHRVHRAMSSRPEWQLWSLLRRHTMEMRQQAGRAVVGRQAERLAAQAEALNAGCETLRLDSDLPVPRYVSAVDTHLMRGGYTGAGFAGDVSNPANYDAGMYATTGGGAGPQNDAAGRALVAWLRAQATEFAPRRIVDLGCGIGHNSLPVQAAFPQAEFIAIDVAEPMLRYGHARARALGFDRVQFVQADATDLPLEDGSADLVLTTMVLHETSYEALPRIFAEAYRLLSPGGLTVHLEQPPYRGLDAFEQFMRDWDGRYNNEPFWSALHEMSLPDKLVAAGFGASDVFESKAQPPAAPIPGKAPQEDFGRAPCWYTVGAWRSAEPDSLKH